MKIWLVSNMYPNKKKPFFGVFVQKVKNGLETDHNVDFLLCCMTFSSNIFIKSLKYFYFFLKQIFQGICFKYDLAYIHFPKRVGFFSATIAKMKRKSVVLNYHGSDLFGNFSEKIINKYLISISDKIIVPSIFFKDLLIQKYPRGVGKVFVSPSGGININFYSNDIYNSNGPIGYVSHINSGKGWEILLDAYESVKTDLPNLIFYGSGSDESILDSRIHNKDRIKFQGAILHENLPCCYSKMSLFVFPSKKESLGLVGLEAMASGVPVIGSNIGGIQSYLSNEFNGFTFQEGDYKDLADKIIKFYNLPNDKRLEMSQNALKTAKQYESKSVIKNLYNVLYQTSTKNIHKNE